MYENGLNHDEFDVERRYDEIFVAQYILGSG